MRDFSGAWSGGYILLTSARRPAAANWIAMASESCVESGSWLLAAMVFTLVSYPSRGMVIIVTCTADCPALYLSMMAWFPWASD